ncbi:MAG: HipA domain-containing protein [Saprospiraceae bacterium]
MNILPPHNSENTSDPITGWEKISVLHKAGYVVEKDAWLTGAAPKRLISIYNVEGEEEKGDANPLPWTKYIAKTAEKWHPVECLTEYLINRIGIALGLPMNAVKLYQHESSLWFCSKLFLSEESDEILMHGTEICGHYMEDLERAVAIADNQKQARGTFTYEFLSSAVSSLFPSRSEMLLNDLFRILVFDCLTGNNDRHFYNWGVITDTTQAPLRMAPIYDSARGLFWNATDRSIQSKFQGQGGLQAYIASYAENSRPRISCKGKSKLNHFELIRLLTSDNPEFKDIAHGLAGIKQETLAIETLYLVASDHFSAFRMDAIEQLLRHRFESIRNVLK